MNSLNNEVMMILGLQLTVGLPEIIICELGALILGFTIHFFWNSKKDLDLKQPEQNTGISDNDNWKLKYYNDMDMQERAQQQLRDRLSQTQETEQILTTAGSATTASMSRDLLAGRRAEVDVLNDFAERARAAGAPARLIEVSVLALNVHNRRVLGAANAQRPK